jgi:hypothetical protein
MPSSDWLDIAIGVVLVWFLFSLVVSATNEAMNRLLAIRAKNLWQALNQLLDGTTTPRGLIADAVALPVAADLRPSDPRRGKETLAHELYATRTVQSLENHPDPSKKTRIAHLPPAVFAQALIELGIRTPEGEERTIEAFIDELDDDTPLKPQLKALWVTASGDLNRFRQSIESWFDGQMQRLSALYRAKVRIVLAGFGVALAIIGFGFGLRTDALGLVTDLERNEDLRIALVGTANETTVANLAQLAGGDCSEATGGTVRPVSETSPSTAKSIDCQLRGAAKLKGLDLALQADKPDPTDSFLDRMGLLFGHVKALLGVLITGVAVSFGSTFWYDSLQRLLGLRTGAGGRTAT